MSTTEPSAFDAVAEALPPAAPTRLAARSRPKTAAATKLAAVQSVRVAGGAGGARRTTGVLAGAFVVTIVAVGAVGAHHDEALAPTASLADTSDGAGVLSADGGSGAPGQSAPFAAGDDGTGGPDADATDRLLRALHEESGLPGETVPGSGGDSLRSGSGEGGTSSAAQHGSSSSSGSGSADSGASGTGGSGSSGSGSSGSGSSSSGGSGSNGSGSGSSDGGSDDNGTGGSDDSGSGDSGSGDGGSNDGDNGGGGDDTPTPTPKPTQTPVPQPTPTTQPEKTKPVTVTSVVGKDTLKVSLLGITVLQLPSKYSVTVSGEPGKSVKVATAEWNKSNTVTIASSGSATTTFSGSLALLKKTGDDPTFSATYVN